MNVADLNSCGDVNMTAGTGSRHRRVRVAVAAVTLTISAGVLTGCADVSPTSTATEAVSVTSAEATTAAPVARPPLRESDVAGSTAHESVAQIVEILNDHGIACTDLTYETPLYDDGEAGTCTEPAESGIPIEIYGSFEHLADGVAGIEGLLALGSPWIPNYVIGKNWTALCGQPEECESVADVLGGTARTTK